MAFLFTVCHRFFYCWNILVRASTKKLAGKAILHVPYSKLLFNYIFIYDCMHINLFCQAFNHFKCQNMLINEQLGICLGAAY